MSFDRLLKQDSAQNDRSDSHTIHFIPGEPCYVVSLGRLGSCFSCSRTVLWKRFSEFLIVPISPLLPPAGVVKFLLQTCCSVLGKQHFYLIFLLIPSFSNPSGCVVLAVNSLCHCHRPCFPSSAVLLRRIASVLCQHLTPCSWQ